MTCDGATSVKNSVSKIAYNSHGLFENSRIFSCFTYVKLLFYVVFLMITFPYDMIQCSPIGIQVLGIYFLFSNVDSAESDVPANNRQRSGIMDGRCPINYYVS